MSQIEGGEPQIHGYQQKIIYLNSQLQSQRSYTEQLKMKYQKAYNELKKNHSVLQQKSKIISNLRSINHKIIARKQQLQIKLKQTQISRKALYDHQFTKPQCNVHQYFDNNLKLAQKISGMKHANYQKIIKQLQQLLSQQNTQTLNLGKKLSKANKQILQLTSEYQSKNQILILQNSSLKQKLTKYSDIDNKIKEYEQNYIQNCQKQSTQAQNINLRQKLSILANKIALDQKEILNLRQKLAYNSYNNGSNMMGNQTKNSEYMGYNHIKKLIYQRDKFKVQFQKLNDKYKSMMIIFPDYCKNEQQIMQMVSKIQKMNQLQTKLSQLNDKLRLSNHKLMQFQNAYKTQLKKYQQDFNLIKQQTFTSQNLKDRMLEKYKKFFDKLAPLYRKLNQGQQQILGFTEQEKQFINDDICMRIDSKFLNYVQVNNQKTKLKTQNKVLSKQLTIKDQVIKKYKVKITALQQTIDKLVVNNTKQDCMSQTLKDQAFIKHIQKMQQQRNQLKIELQRRQLDLLAINLKNIRLQQQLAAELVKIYTQPTKQLQNYLNADTSIKPQINLIDFNKLIYHKLDSQAQNLKQQLDSLKKQFQNSQQETNRAHQNQILSFNIQIGRLKEQNQQLAKALTSQQLANKDYIQMIDNQQLDTMNKLKPHRQISIQQIEQQQQQVNQQMDIPPNTLSAQSIQQLAKLLSGHQTLLNNIMMGFRQLYYRIQALQTQKQQIRQIKQSQGSKQEELDHYRHELQLAMKRLQQNDANINILQERIEAKQNQLKQCQANHKQQMEILESRYKNMEKQYKGLHEFVEQSKSKQTYQQLSQTLSSSGQQIQYLLSLVDNFRNRIRELSQELESQRQKNIQNIDNEPVSNNIDNNTIAPINLETNKYLKMLIDSNINDVLEKTISHLQNQNKQKQNAE